MRRFAPMFRAAPLLMAAGPRPAVSDGFTDADGDGTLEIVVRRRGDHWGAERVFAVAGAKVTELGGAGCGWWAKLQVRQGACTAAGGAKPGLAA